MIDDISLKSNLKKWFGYAEFRSGQLDVIKALIQKEDTLAVLPTGTGKTLIYQYMGKLNEGTVIIVSPLISLMQDQVDRMRFLGEKRTIALNSSLNWYEKKKITKNLASYKYIYISPEMLSNDEILDNLKKINISLFVVDEAHCINQWGPDFRPEYLNLKKIISFLGSPLTLLLTATASNEVIDDIKNKIGIVNLNVIKYSANRPNIALDVEIIDDRNEKNERLLSLVNKVKKPGIIYFSSKKVANSVCRWLNDQTNLSVEAYHADIDNDSRYKIQHQFINDKIDVICATSAFGMGIDKDNIRFVIHYHMPSNLESYVQEMGRAGRDGEQSISYILYREKDEILQYRFIDEAIPTEDMIDFFYRNSKSLLKANLDEKGDLVRYYFEKGYELDETKSIFYNRRNELIASLNDMIEYVHSNGCYRQKLLNHFNEDFNNHDNQCCNGMQTELKLDHMNLISTNKDIKSGEKKEKWQNIIQSLFSN